MKDKQGNLSKIGLPKLLHLIYKKADPAAVLDIIREPVKKRFYFKNGMPVAASSNILNEVLGRLLMQENIITQEEYEKSLEIVIKEKRKHGEVLISMGLINNEQLNSFLTLQTKRRLLKVFEWTDGTYRYTKADALPDSMTQFPLHPASLILEGISLGFYPVSKVKDELGEYLDQQISKSTEPGRYNLDSFRLNLQEKRFFESFNGTKTLRETLEGSDLLRHRAVAISLSLIITGLLAGPGTRPEPEFEEGEKEAHAIETGGPSRLNAEILFMRAKSALLAKDFKSAIKILKEITDLNPTEGEYWAYLGWAIFNDNPQLTKEAEKIIKDSIDLNNELDSAWYFLGVVCLSMGNAMLAEISFRNAALKNPWNLEAVSELKRIELKKSLPVEQEKGYRHSYGFTDDPFLNVPSARKTTLIESRTQVLDAIAKAVKKKSGPILLEGIPGVGKTTICLELLRRLSNDKMLAAVILNPQEREIQLIKAINTELNASTDGTTIKEQLLSLGMRVSQNKIQGGHTAIIIDNAHLLSSGCLKLIQYLSRLKTLQIILIGDPLLSSRLKEPDFTELDGKIALRLELHPLTLDEVGEYVSARVDSVLQDPGSSILAFSTDAIKILFEESGGVPSIVNAKAAQVLESAAELELTTIDDVLTSGVLREKETPPSPELSDIFEIEEKSPEEPYTEQEPFVTAHEEAKAEEIISMPEEKPQEQKAEAAPEITHNEPEPPAPAQETPAEPYRNLEERVEQSHHPVQKPLDTVYTQLEKETVQKPKSFLKLIIWILVMLITGLVIGSLIGIFWMGPKNATEEPPVIQPSSEHSETAAPIDASTAIEGSSIVIERK
ncbi:MAG: AAA family ATPase [Deltaproteobacteria bacterium]|nr:AAA family ATPase [Deltaproteobacteria bacterium]